MTAASPPSIRTTYKANDIKPITFGDTGNANSAIKVGLKNIPNQTVIFDLLPLGVTVGQ
ncbi:MAG: hypothetical protein JWN01_978 [Patescibacteria group bacterium]|nr:hypothetical protein [Patescibacteria group bacterium]